MVLFWDSFKASKDTPRRGIFPAYPVEKNIPLNLVQEFIAIFAFLFPVLGTVKAVPGLGAREGGLGYRLIVNLPGGSQGGITAVLTVGALFK